MNKIYSSFKNSCNGLKIAWTEDHSFRNSTLQVFAGIIAASFLKYYLDGTGYFWLMLVASMFPIVSVETVNCSIEAVTDKASPEKHPLAKKAKDLGSAAVFLTRILAIICWTVVIGKQLQLLHGN